MERIQPICRYQHGLLERQEGLWSFSQVKRAEGPQPPAGATTTHYEMEPTGVDFIFSLFRCPRCGYMEIFDDEEAA